MSMVEIDEDQSHFVISTLLLGYTCPFAFSYVTRNSLRSSGIETGNTCSRFRIHFSRDANTHSYNIIKSQIFSSSLTEISFGAHVRAYYLMKLKIDSGSSTRITLRFRHFRISMIINIPQGQYLITQWLLLPGSKEVPVGTRHISKKENLRGVKLNTKGNKLKKTVVKQTVATKYDV